MMKVNHLLLAGSLAAILCVGATEVLGQNAQGGGRQGGGRQGRGNNAQGGGRQGGGNFDPAQFQQRMMERYKETLEVTDETEWKVIQPLVQKVMDARRAIGFGGRGMGGRGQRQGGDNNQAAQNPRPGFGAPNPELEALQKAIDSKAATPELKTALAKYLEARKAKQGDLEKAQAELRKVLTPRQEAIAAVSGLL
jgi:hypothetical protein